MYVRMYVCKEKIMSYVNPALVTSPKDRISKLEILHDGGENSYSIAKMTWEGREGTIGVRWNGGENNGVGNPQSRGIPTWFILPEPLGDFTKFFVWAEKKGNFIASEVDNTSENS